MAAIALPAWKLESIGDAVAALLPGAPGIRAFAFDFDIFY